ncbi:MAG: FkbM family methyltransferase [Terracidiphilus sp.]|jgi:FkbM family methyltransferase
MFLSRYRQTVDTYAPLLGRSYRLLRDAIYFRHFVQTKYGFRIAGDSRIAQDNWEVDQIDAFLELIKTHDVVLDLGANIGIYSCLAASRGKHVIAVEPSPRNLKFLYRNLLENRFNNVEVFPLALAQQCGIQKIYGFGDTASLIPGWAHARKAQPGLAPAITLDAIAAGRFQNKKLLVKMDVEGYELEVLRGATEILDSRVKPTWMIEIGLCNDYIPGGINHNFTATFDMFWKRGYQCRMIHFPLTLVTQDDIGRWVNNGIISPQNASFLFWVD